jgi:hypothetical protein
VGHLLDVRPDGRALLSLADERDEMVAQAPGLARERDISWLDASAPLQLSRDGSLLLFDESGQGGARTRPWYLRPTDGSAPAVLVAEGSGRVEATAALSPDAKWLLVWQPERPGDLRLLPTGPGEPKTIGGQGIEYLSSLAVGGHRVLFLLPDNRRLVALGREPGRPWRSWVQDIDGGRPRPVTPEGQFAEAVSPDGAMTVARDTGKRLVLHPVEVGEARPAPGPPEPGRILVWSADGKALFIRETDEVNGLAVRILRRDLRTGRRELWREVRPPDQAGLAGLGCVVSADGRAYACFQYRTLSSLFLVEGLK